MLTKEGENNKYLLHNVNENPVTSTLEGGGRSLTVEDGTDKMEEGHMRRPGMEERRQRGLVESCSF